MRGQTRWRATAAAAFLAAGLAGFILAHAGRNRGGRFADDGGQSPLGTLFDRAARVSNLKQQMGELRGVWPAMDQFAREHLGRLPTNLMELRPYLPADLAGLSDAQWEMPCGGVAADAVMQRNDKILLQQKEPPGEGRIAVYADGHIEYRK